MGNSRFTDASWTLASAAPRAAKSHAEVFRNTTVKKEFDPVHIKIRESRDSEANPKSTPVMIWLDGTGSMGNVAHQIAKDELGKVFSGIYDRKPVTDPHILAGMIGDVLTDRFPSQATQFEGDIKVHDQLLQLVIEGNGGGNGTETYDGAWYFAATKTVADNWEKRGKKGFLFTIGDEPAPRGLTSENILRMFGDHVQKDLTAAELLKMAQEKWEVFHLIIAQGGGSAYPNVKSSWNELMGERAINVDDFTKLGEIIISTMQIINGTDFQTVVSSWSGDTSLTVANAVGALAKQSPSEALATL